MSDAANALLRAQYCKLAGLTQDDPAFSLAQLQELAFGAATIEVIKDLGGIVTTPPGGGDGGGDDGGNGGGGGGGGTIGVGGLTVTDNQDNTITATPSGNVTMVEDINNPGRVIFTPGGFVSVSESNGLLTVTV